MGILLVMLNCFPVQDTRPFFYTQPSILSDYLEAVGSSIDPQRKKIIDESYDKVKQQFLDSGGKAKRKGWIELKEFLKSEDIIDSLSEQKIEEELNRRYSDVNELPRKAWAGLDVESMTEELVKGGIIDDFQKRMLLQTYIKGNSKNHFSPTDILSFLNNEQYKQTNDADLILSLVVTTIAVARITKILMDELDVPDETIQSFEEIWQTLLNANISIKKG